MCRSCVVPYRGVRAAAAMRCWKKTQKLEYQCQYISSESPALALSVVFTMAGQLGRLIKSRPTLWCRALCTQPLPIVVSADADVPAVKLLTLSSPSNLNAMTVSMGEAVVAAVDSLRDLPPSELKAVVLTGEGRAFSAGGDLKFLEARKVDTPTNNSKVMRQFYSRFITALRTLPVPVVACINGPAIGAGLCFAMGADVRVTHDAAKLGFTFVGLGLHPGMGCTHTIAAACGGQAASRLLLTGDVISGAEAQRIGLVAHSLHDADAASAEAVAIARRIAAQSPLAVRATLLTLRSSSDERLNAALQREADAQAQSYASADYAEGLLALREKRPPAFEGR